MTKGAIFGAVAILTGALAAAPIPKGKEPPPATDKQRDLARDHLKQLMLAFHNYESALGHFPHDLADKKGKPILSWRVAILPYFDRAGAGDELYKKFALDEPWDSETNKPLIAEMPKFYKPVRVEAEAGRTFLRGFAGNGALFEPGKKRRVIDIAGADGTSNTIGIIEAGESVVWTKPESDIAFDPKKPLPPLGKDIDGVFHAARLDGSILRIKRDFDEETLKAAITIAGGEVPEWGKISPPEKNR